MTWWVVMDGKVKVWSLPTWDLMYCGILVGVVLHWGMCLHTEARHSTHRWALFRDRQMWGGHVSTLYSIHSGVTWAGYSDATPSHAIHRHVTIYTSHLTKLHMVRGGLLSISPRYTWPGVATLNPTTLYKTRGGLLFISSLYIWTGVGYFPSHHSTHNQGCVTLNLITPHITRGVPLSISSLHT